MDLSIAMQHMLSGHLSDLELRLVDSDNTIILYVHKIILSMASPYFNKKFLLFDDGKSAVQTITVENAVIMADVIESLYGGTKKTEGYPDWYYLLVTFICRSFLCLENDVTKLYNLKVPVDGFEFLLTVIQNYKLEKYPKLIRVVRDNLPANYDLSGHYSPELIDKIMNPILFISNHLSSFAIHDMYSGTPVYIFDEVISWSKCSSISPNKKLIAFFDSDLFIKIWDIENKVLVNTIGPISSASRDKILRNLCFDKNGKFIVSLDSNFINVWDVTTGLCVYTMDGAFVSNSKLTSDNLLIVLKSYDRRIDIFDFPKNILVDTISFSNFPKSIELSHNEKLLVIYMNGESMGIYNFKTKNILKLSEHKDNYHNTILFKFSSDDKLIVTLTFEEAIVWDSTTGLKLVESKDFYWWVKDLSISNDNRFILLTTNDKFIVWDWKEKKFVNEFIKSQRQDNPFVCFLDQ